MIVESTLELNVMLLLNSALCAVVSGNVVVFAFVNAVAPAVPRS